VFLHDDVGGYRVPRLTQLARHPTVRALVRSEHATGSSAPPAPRPPVLLSELLACHSGCHGPPRIQRLGAERAVARRRLLASNAVTVAIGPVGVAGEVAPTSASAWRPDGGWSAREPLALLCFPAATTPDRTTGREVCVVAVAGVPPEAAVAMEGSAATDTV